MISAKNLKIIPYRKQGFTLIELLIVVTVMIIMTSVGIVRYRDAARRQSLKAAVDQVKSDMRLAQELALSGYKPPGCTNLQGYLFTRQNNTQYAIEAYCKVGGNNTCCFAAGGCGSSDPNFCVKRDVTLSGFQVQWVASYSPPNPPNDDPKNSSITFRVLGRGTNADGNSSKQIILRIRNPAFGVSYDIVVGSTGEIR